MKIFFASLYFGGRARQGRVGGGERWLTPPSSLLPPPSSNAISYHGRVSFADRRTLCSTLACLLLFVALAKGVQCTSSLGVADQPGGGQGCPQSHGSFQQGVYKYIFPHAPSRFDHFFLYFFCIAISIGPCLLLSLPFRTRTMTIYTRPAVVSKCYGD